MPHFPIILVYSSHASAHTGILLTWMQLSLFFIQTNQPSPSIHSCQVPWDFLVAPIGTPK